MNPLTVEERNPIPRSAASWALEYLSKPVRVKKGDRVPLFLIYNNGGTDSLGLFPDTKRTEQGAVVSCFLAASPPVTNQHEEVFLSSQHQLSSAGSSRPYWWLGTGSPLQAPVCCQCRAAPADH
eukprot:XP_011615515.1 PREDICTED: uncharacterized protein LOC105418250 [Takifugu rubripes]